MEKRKRYLLTVLWLAGMLLSVQLFQGRVW